MSIRDAIRSHEGTELFQVQSAFFGEETLRYVFVSAEVFDFIHREVDDREGRLGRMAKGILDMFIEGDPITVRWNPHDLSTCIMARVDSKNSDYEIWDLRSWDPYPGARIFGAFAEHNVFVALIWEDRDHIGNDFAKQAEFCIEVWRRLFGDAKPFKAGTLNDYFTKPHKVV